MNNPEKYDITKWCEKYINNDTVGLDNLVPFHKEHIKKLTADIDNRSITEKLMENLARDTVKKENDRFVNLLKENGYTFDNTKELEEFVKKHCKLEKRHDKYCTLFLDDKPIAQWWDTVRFEQNGNKFTAIMGEKPE